MKHRGPIALLALAGCATTPYGPQVVPAETHRAVVLTVGEREFDDDLFEAADVDEQDGFGLSYEWEMGTFVWEVGFLGSEEDGEIATIDVEVTVTELYLGARYQFQVGVSPVRPYLGGGVSLVKADVDGDSGLGDDDDSSAGIYIHAGADWFITDSFFIGLAYRILTGTDLEVFDEDTDADYEQLALRLGFSF